MIYLKLLQSGIYRQKDIWITGDKIVKIGEPDNYFEDHPVIKTIPCDDLTAFPGIIDGHKLIIISADKWWR